MSSVVLSVGLLIFFGHLLTGVFDRWKLPDVLVLMLLGVLLGPYVLGLVEPNDFGKVGAAMTSIALILILFDGGLGLKLSTIREAASDTTRITLITSALTVALVAGIARPWLPGWSSALVLGGVLAGTSSAVVIPLVSGLRMRPRIGAVLNLESALTDVLCILLVFGFLEAAVAGHFDTATLLGGILSSLTMASVLGVVGGLVWVLAADRVRRLPNNFTAVFAFLFVIYGVTELLGYSGAICALSFGITLRNVTPSTMGRVPGLSALVAHAGSQEAVVTERDRAFFGESVFLVKIFFFMYLGISLRFDQATAYGVAALIVLAVYGGRFLAVRLWLDRGFDRQEAAVSAVMVPKGLAAAALAALPLQRGLEGGEFIRDVAFAVVAVSILLTSVAAPLLHGPSTKALRARVFGAFAPEDEDPAPSEVVAPSKPLEPVEGLAGLVLLRQRRLWRGRPRGREGSAAG